MNQKLKWISSCGGPFILTTKSTALNWLGIDGVSARESVGCNNDYEIACQVIDLVGKIHGSPNEILVMGDLPNDLAWVRRSDEEGLIVKWIGADSDEQVLNSLQDVNFDNFKILPISIEFEETELLMFDSASKFNEIEDNYLQISLKPGEYKISFIDFQPNENIWLHLFHLKRNL
jgi:hypothetical protein